MIEFDFRLRLPKWPSLALWQTAASCRYLIYPEIKPNHTAAKGLILKQGRSNLINICVDLHTLNSRKIVIYATKY